LSIAGPSEGEIVKMRRVMASGMLVGALALAGSSQAAGPVTKQNGSDAVIKAFTSICAVAGFANYGLCGGDTTKFTNVGGKMNAVQSKTGRYNLDFVFTNLTPGVEYRLWATRDATVGGGTYAEVGRAIADAAGSAKYQLQTDSPGGLGFDLNTLNGDITIVTSWWSGQKLVLKADGTLTTAI
jgi:hypothetical protein